MRQPTASRGAPTAGPDEGGAVEGWEAPARCREATDTGDGGMARVNLRMPDQLKVRAEQAAANERVSLNAWLVKAVTAALDRAGPQTTLATRRARAASAMSGGRASTTAPAHFTKQTEYPRRTHANI